MPGASWTNPGKLIAERSAKELIGIFVVMPVLVGVGILAVVMRNAMVNAATYTFADWFWHVGWASVVGLAVATTLPLVAIQEFRRRRAQRVSSAERI
jgi:hypothetical protein